VPFRFSAKGTSLPELFTNDPTATHSVDDVHDTSSRKLSLEPVGAGGSWTDQVVPFHFSAKGTYVAELLSKYPTATHSVDDVHDTPIRLLYVAPVGTGGSWEDQVVPFHFSAKGTIASELFTNNPTATHSVDDAHDT
jgi:hypothetical protein